MTIVRTDLGNVQGPPGTSIFIKGWHSSLEYLKEEHPVGEENDAWNVGGQLYVWDPEHSDWQPMDIEIVSFGDVKANLLLGESWEPSVTVDTDIIEGQMVATFTFNNMDASKSVPVFSEGVDGLVPGPEAEDAGKVLSTDGWADVSVEVVKGATEDTDGAEGLVPKPLAGQEGYVLMGDGQWHKANFQPDTVAMLGAAISASPAEAKPGGTTIITVTLTHKGEEADAQNVKVTGTLPDAFNDLEPSNVSSDKGSAESEGKTFTAIIETLAYGETATITVAATVSSEAPNQSVTVGAIVSSDGMDAVSVNTPVTIKKSLPSSYEEFANASWSDIADLAEKVKENPSQYSHMIGWKKPVAYGSPISKQGEVEIVDICHEDYGADHAFVFMSTTSLIQSKFNDTANTMVNFGTSSLKTNLDSGIIWNSYPEELRSVMKEVSIKYFTNASTTDFSGSGAKSESCKLFLPCYAEIGLLNKAGGSYAQEGSVFQGFASATDTKRIRNTIGSTTAAGWWTRSMHMKTAYSACFGIINTSGSWNGYQEVGTYGVVPIFCI